MVAYAHTVIPEYVEMRGRGPSNYLLDHTMQSDVKDKPFLEFGNKNKIFSKTQIQASETIGQGSDLEHCMNHTCT